jgi:TrpR-related protein YerC/YecD
MKSSSHRDPKAAKALYEAFLRLTTPDEVARFLHDLCTPQEIADFIDRWQVARLLDDGQLSYREIHAQTGVSVTTVGRVARFLTEERYKGYRLVLDRIKDQ